MKPCSTSRLGRRFCLVRFWWWRRTQARSRPLTDLSGVLGPWSGDLSDEYAVVRLVDGNRGDVDTVEYRNADGWPLAADGSGSSLELIDVNSDNNIGSHWAESVERGGTPGRKNDVAEGSVVINEFLASSDLGTADWIELYNRGDTERDISGWYLTDDAATLTEWIIPPRHGPTTRRIGVFRFAQFRNIGRRRGSFPDPFRRAHGGKQGRVRRPAGRCDAGPLSGRLTILELLSRQRHTGPIKRAADNLRRGH